MARLNVALIGYAFMGRAHSNAWRQVTRFFTPKHMPVMKVICGRTLKNVQTAADQLGWDEAATDWREVVHRKDIDLVDISTPGDSHAEIAIEAAKAGKVVFCEKPLANTVKETEQMLAAVKKAGVIHMVCHNYRRAPAVMLARRLIEDGKLGQLYHYRGTYLQDWIVDPKFPLVWRLRKESAGSGALGDIASHSLDLARFLVGEITEVTAALETFVKERPLPENPKQKGPVTVDDASAAVVRFENGALGTIEASRFATGRKNYNRFEINGSKGSVVFNLERMNELEVFLTGSPESEIIALVGDGCYMFGVPTSAYWVARTYATPFLTIIYNNGGWNAPKFSTLGVHPEGSAKQNDSFWVTVGTGARLADVAAAAGAAEAFHVSHREQLAPALDRALATVRAGRCAVVDVAVTRISSQVLG